MNNSGGGSGGDDDSSGLVNTFAKLVMGGGPTPPEYGPGFSRKNSTENMRITLGA